MRDVVIDFETANPDPKLLKDGGAWRYAEDELTEILCCVFGESPNDLEVWSPCRRGNEKRFRKYVSDPNIRFVSHGDFESAIWDRIMVRDYGFPPIAEDRWHDIMAVAATKGLPLGLEQLCEALHLPIEKDMEGRKFTLSLGIKTDRSDEAITRVIEYCVTDVKAEWAAHKRLGELPKEELAGYRWHRKLNRQGLRLDPHLIAKAQEVVDKATVPRVAEFKELTGFKPTQTRELAKLFGFKNAKDKLSIDAETVEWALDNAELSPEHRRALEIRQLIGSASVKKLPRMAACICMDGRARGLSQFHGTQPGRNAGRLWQPYNLPRPTFEGFNNPVPPDVVVDAIMTGDPEYVECAIGTPPIETVVSGLRHIIIPDPGKIFIAGDYAGIQLRILLALAGQRDKLKLITDGGDPYCDMATLIYKRTITKADKEERHMGKCAVLGLGFGMGWKRFQQQFAKGFGDQFCQNVVSVYREEWAPKVVKLWHMFERGSIAASAIGKRYESSWEGLEWCRDNLMLDFEKKDDYLAIYLPSKRKLWYPAPKVERVWFEGNEKFYTTVTCDVVKNGRTVRDKLYGARLCENVVMGIEVDIQRKGWANAEANGFDIVFDCYDELVAEVEEWQADKKLFRDCLLDQDQWVDELRIPVDVPLDEMWIGDRYRK